MQNRVDDINDRAFVVFLPIRRVGEAFHHTSVGHGVEEIQNLLFIEYQRADTQPGTLARGMYDTLRTGCGRAVPDQSPWIDRNRVGYRAERLRNATAHHGLLMRILLVELEKQLRLS